MRALWLPDILRDAGIPIHVEPGFARRGGEMRAIHGVVNHDTVTPGWKDADVLRLLRDGRSDLKGMLSQLGIARHERKVWVIGSGKAFHNGYGPIWGNDSIGIEVACGGGFKGREEPWSAAQFELAAMVNAAILRYLRKGTTGSKGHKETDAARKMDPFRVDMNHFRTVVFRILQAGPNNPHHPKEEVESMKGISYIVIPAGKRRSVPLPGSGLAGRVAVSLHCDFDTPTVRIARWEGGRLVGIGRHTINPSVGRNVVWFDNKPEQRDAVWSITNPSTTEDVTVAVEYGLV